MQTTVLNMSPQVAQEQFPETILTFRPFVNYLKNRKEESNCHKSRFFSFVVEQFEKNPELLKTVDIEKIKDYESHMQLIYSMVSPVIEDEDKHRWALCLPLKPVVFYGTNAYFNLVSDIATGNLRKSVATKDPVEMKRQRHEFIYSLILEKLYNIPSFFSRDIVHTLEDEQTGLTKYFKLNLDTRFIEIYATRAFPELKAEELRIGTSDHNEALAFFEKRLPLDLFRFEGFSIITITDVTAEYALENIKSIILHRSSFEDEGYYHSVIQSLKALVGSSEIEFGLLPVLKVNNKLIFNDTECVNSKLISAAREKGMGETTYMSLANEYFKNPKQIFFREISQEDEAKHVYIKILKAKGISGYALSPVYFNNKLAGVLEIYSEKKGVLNESLLSRLDPAMPLLAQLLKNSIDEFENSIDHVVKEKFTAIQPSVQWKFNEVAWHYLRNGMEENRQKETEEIIFEKVYPLYGAVDVRNSTVERNGALRADLQVQFTILLEVLKELREKTGFGLLDEKIFQSKKWLEKINSTSATFNQEVRLNDFLENNISPFLSQFKEGNPAIAAIIDRYIDSANPETGEATENRRQLETSMNTVISSVNKYMDMMKNEIQQAYPSYFEKFRTDGVEYDIYIGQSIAPDKPFSDIYLKNLRLLQLTSMAAIAKYSNALLPQLAKPVETTQLIFIHSQAIDIKFRKDEKRFDVEGAYNIRYHIVKKRIDKVNIKNKKERLTQPGKIALVYFSQKEADEYISYIKYLQEQNILLNDLEELELEELQGVSGLKALRVGVAID
jgi:hypothetical protein